MKHREQFSPTPGPQKSISRWFTGAGIATLTCFFVVAVAAL